jgi:uncharacterized membrane protein
MESLFKGCASAIALGVEAAAALIIVVGAVQAFVAILRSLFQRQPAGTRKQIWLGFGAWLLLGLEFELAADVVRTAIAPTWTEIGQLGAIAVIRTFLNYFLEKDLEKYYPAPEVGERARASAQIAGAG